MRKLFLFLIVFLMITTVSARIEQHAGFPVNTGSPIKSLLVVQDIDGDGKPEIIAAPDNRMIKVFNYMGVLDWEKTGGINLADEARTPLVANISGRLEIISYGNPGYSDATFYIWDTVGNNIANITLGKYLLISSPSITKEGIILTGSAPGSSLGSITQATGVYAFDSNGNKLWYLELGKAVNYRAPIPVGDIDGDGIDEAVILTQDINSANPIDGKIWVIKVNGITGTILWSRDLGGDARSARLGDFDGNGRNEIIVTSSSGVYIFDNSGNQIYKFNIKSNLASPVTGDIDGTGVIGAALASNDDKKVYLIRNGSLKEFSSIGRVDSNLALGDLNGDGKMEIAAGDSYGNLYLWDNQGNVLENTRVANDMFTSATIADLEGDGNKEIILGNSNGKIYAYTYFNEPVDRIPPATTDDVDGQWHNSSVVVTLTAGDNESGVAATYYTIDGTEPTINSTEGTTISISNEGIYTIKYFSVDKAGNVEATKTAPNQVKIDKTSPLTTDNADGQWYNSSVSVMLNASDSGSGIMETYYTTDGSIPTSSSLKGTTVSISGEGNHTIRYYSVDNAGNAEQPHAATIRIDDIPPLTEDDSDNMWHTASVTLNITASDNISGVEAINYIVDGVEQVSNLPHIQLTFNKEGGHTIKYFSLDNANNAGTMKTAVVRITMSLPATMDNSGGKYDNSDTTPKLSATDKLPAVDTTSYSTDEGCTSCHKIRHGTTGNNCENCHYNTTFSNGKHPEKPFSPGFMHDSFDWEGDNANEKGADRLNESCPVCHVKMTDHTSPELNVCEDCHVKLNPELSSLANVRPDITKYIPVVYSHYTGSPINVTDQSSLGNTRSSCFGFDAATGEGSCHAVTFGNKAKAGGYFSFNTNYTGTLFNRGDPYHWNSPVDYMPDSKNCIFCHIQENENIRKAWGAPKALPSDSQHSNVGNKDCWGCHVEGELKSFHGKEIVKTVKKPYLTYIAAFSLVIAIVALWFWKKQK